MADKEQINDSLKNPNKNFNENYTHNKNQIIIDTNKYFLEVVDEGGGTVGYRVLHPERLLRDIIKQNKQLARKTQECEQLQEKYEALKLENEEGYEIVDELKQECEELKEKLRELELKNTTLQNRNQQLDGSITESTRYLKALEEIGDNINKYFEEGFYKNCRYAKGCTSACGLATNRVLNKTLDIINKAKGEINE